MRAAAERRCDASDKLFLVGRTLVVVTFDVFDESRRRFVVVFVFEVDDFDVALLFGDDLSVGVAVEVVVRFFFVKSAFSH